MMQDGRIKGDSDSVTSMEIDMEEKIKARVAELETARQQFVDRANTQIAMMNGAISELRKLLELPQKPVAREQ
jgi:hypothetical protein